jgi:hypothetical protein
MAPLRDFGTPILAILEPKAYTMVQRSFDAGTPDGGRYYWKSQYLPELREGAIDTIVDRAESLLGPFTSVTLEHLGGAVSRVDPTATASDRMLILGRSCSGGPG